MNRLLRRSRSANLDAAANLPPLVPLAAVPPAHAAPGAGLHPRAPAPAPMRHGNVAPAAPAAVRVAPPAAPLHHGVGRELIPCLDNAGAPAPAPADGLPPTITHFLRFKLDLAVGNYSKWRHLFYCLLCKYNAQQHVDEDRDPAHEDAVWRNDDITIA